MKKKRIFLIIIILIIILTIILATLLISHKNSEITTDDKKIEQIDELTLSLKEDGYDQNGDYNYDISCFNDVKLILRGNHSNNTYLIHNNGEVWEYNFPKIFTNNMNTLKLNTKIDEKIDVAFIDSDDNIWFVSSGKLIKLDTTNDKKTEENGDSLNSVIFRGNEFISAYKKNSFDAIYNIGYYSSLLIQKDNKLYSYNYVDDYEGVYDSNGNKSKYNPYSEEYLLDINIDLNTEKIEYIDQDFIKTSNGYYKKGIINQEEVDKYADVKEQRGYIKLKSSQYINDIIYMDSRIAITNDRIYQIGL